MKKHSFNLEHLLKRKLNINDYIFAVFLALTLFASLGSIVGNMLTNFPMVANIKWVLAIIFCGIGFFLIHKQVFVEAFKTTVFLAILFLVVLPSWFMGGGDNTITMLYTFLLAVESLLVFEKLFLKWGMVLLNMLALIACVGATYQFPHLIDTTHTSQNVFADTLLQICIVFVLTAVSVNIYVASYRKQHLLLEKANENLEIAATIDSLSQVYNRRKIFEIFSQIRDKNKDKDIFVLMIDIDFFKSINDVNGHQMGDKAIHHFASHLSEVIGKGTVGRYGGDEFIAFFTDIGEDALRAILEKVIAIPPLNELTFTTSGGLAKSLPGQSNEDIIQAADRLLLEAKENGRNQIQMYDGSAVLSAIPHLFSQRSIE